MKPFEGFKSEASNKKISSLPAGPYVARIIGTHIEGDEPDQRLIIRVDVSEGEYKDFFMNKFRRDTENSKFEPRYKGDFRLRIPNAANTNAMYPESDLRNFNDAIYRIEKSNPGYAWDWDETGLIGKLVGINMQLNEFNGAPYTKIGRLEIADDVRKGIVKPMPPKGQKAANAASDAQAGYKPANDQELPWY